MANAMPTSVEIGQESEEPRRWRYEVFVHEGEEEGQVRHAFEVTLNWADYDHWSHGRVAPQRVVDAVFRFLLEREPPSAILRKFDCSLVRRYFPEVDQQLPRMI